jgi:hypothetical protein
MFAVGCATTQTTTKQPRSGNASTTPSWLAELEHNIVVLTVDFDASENSVGVPIQQSGAGIIIGISDAQASILTVRHILHQPESKLSSVHVRFWNIDPIHVEKPSISSITHLNAELNVISMPLSARAATVLRAALAPIKVGSFAEALYANESSWLSGRCGQEAAHSDRLSELRPLPSNTEQFEVESSLAPGCSGGAIFSEGRLIGLLQQTDTFRAMAASTSSVLAQLRGFRPGSTDDRNLLEPVGTLVFEDPPHQSWFRLDQGPELPLMPRNIVLAGKADLFVKIEGSEEVASGPVVLHENQELECRAMFATPMTRFRQRSRVYLVSGSVLVAALGLGFLGLGSIARNDFEREWSREARDRNHLYTNLGLGTLIGGAVLIAASSAFAFLGDAREDSNIKCK